MDLNLIRTFAAVAQARSFSDAAKRLGLPKSSVSRSIARLEAATRVQLLRRTTRQVTLTPAGTALFDRVRLSLEGLESAMHELPETDEQPSGELRITGPGDLGGFLLAEAAVRFTARYPAVTVDAVLTNRLVDLVAEGFDLAFRISPRPLKDSSLVARKLAPVQGQLYASPQYLERRGTPRTVKDLNDHDWVLFRAAPKKLTLNDGSEVTPRGRVRCDDMLFSHAAIRAGGGIGFLPRWLAEADMKAGTLVPVLPRHAQMNGYVYLVHPAARHVPLKVTAFRDVLLEVMKGCGA
jgi:DNA-binding transcriptional LysR family regulator